MLYNRKWDKKRSPYLDYSKAAATLVAAADYLEEHGWCQGCLHDAEGRSCILGAFLKVQTDGSGVLAANVLEKSLKAAKPLLRGSIGWWNDHVCQSKEQAIQALCDAAIL